jgi:hypothetical protein
MLGAASVCSFLIETGKQFGERDFENATSTNQKAIRKIQSFWRETIREQQRFCMQCIGCATIAKTTMLLCYRRTGRYTLDAISNPGFFSEYYIGLDSYTIAPCIRPGAVRRWDVSELPCNIKAMQASLNTYLDWRRLVKCRKK